MTKKTLEQSMKDLAAIRESGVEAGWLGTTAEYHVEKIEASLRSKQNAASKTRAKLKTPVLDRIREKSQEAK